MLIRTLCGLMILSVLTACAAPGKGGFTHAAAHMGVPKGAIGRDHSVLNDDLPRAAHEQRRTDIATP
jgi:hypothetical protein